MSYILEALKKSKEERQSEDAPHLHTVHRVPAFKPRSRMLGSDRAGMVLGGVIAVAVVAGGLSVFFFSEDTREQVIEPPRQSITVRQLEIRSQFNEQGEEGTVVVQGPIEGIDLPVIRNDRPQVITIPRRGEKKIVLETSLDDTSHGENQFQEIKYRKELPANILKELPELVFAGHTYADDPGRRMIIINNAILREGDDIDTNTKLLNIIWEGVVLEYKGVVFKQRTH